MAFAQRTDGGWREIVGAFTAGTGEDAITYPSNWIDLAAPVERASAGLVEIAEAGPQPTDRKVTGSVIVDNAGQPERVWTSEPYSLADARDLAWTRAKTFRDAHATAGCDTPLGRVDTTEVAQRLIGGAASAAIASIMLQQPFPTVGWTMADNTVVQHDAQQMIAMGMSVMQFVSACQAASTIIRDRINTAPTPEAAIAVDWTAGYP